VIVRNARGRSLLLGHARRWRTASLAALLLVTAASTLQNAVAEGETRTLSFHHVHTGEDITVTFKRNGRYDEAALAKLNWFMRDWRKDQETTMDRQLFDLLWEAYRDVGGAEPIQVICGYRSPQTNSMLRSRSSGVAQFSLHTQGDAMDFYIPGVALEKVREVGLRMQRGGVGFYPTSGSPFVHLDTGAIRHWPRMTHDQLVRVFPNERTVHVPSDGQPLAGYAMALADVERQGRAPNSASFAAARNAGAIGDDEERTASVTDKRSLFARMFGPRDETNESAAKPKKPVLRESIAVAQIPVSATPVAATTERIVPVPKGRPVMVAAATPTPRSRPQMMAAANPLTERGLWPLEVASADPGVTAALAYAPASDARVPVRPSAPMGNAAAAIADAGSAKNDRLAATATFESRFEASTPWMRAMILTPSVTAVMTTTRLGALDAQPIAEFMRKPASALVMTFADDPHSGMETSQFSGNAVVFLATATFRMQTALLVR
jgi:uncharacterized protein YcbK (DUF882 family)